MTYDPPAAPPSTRPSSRRARPSPWPRVPAMVATYLFAWPVFRLGALLLGWPRLLASPVVPKPIRDFGPYEASPHDVFAAVYFKSGTTWCMQIALQVAHRGRAEYEHIHDLVAWPDAQHPHLAVPLADESPRRCAPTGLRVIKTHLPAPQVPQSPSARYLCVLRDPKDVFVSSYHFVRAVAFGPMMPPVGAWLDYFLSPGFAWGSWAEHLDGWWRLREHDNVLLLMFDDLKADLPGTIRRISDLLGVELTEEEADLVQDRSSFQYMRENDDRFNPGVQLPWTSVGKTMIRRGTSGGSSALLTEAQQRRIDDHHRAELERLGSDFPYDRCFGPGAR